MGAERQKEAKERDQTQGDLGVLETTDPFVPAPIFVMEKRSTRGAFVVLRDGADDFGNKPEGSGGGGSKIRPQQSESNHPVRSGQGGGKTSEEGQKQDESSRIRRTSNETPISEPGCKRVTQPHEPAIR
jgi:hypothetical protein